MTQNSIGLLVCFIGLILTSCDRKQPIEGHQDFKFGMTLQEAEDLIHKHNLCQLNFERVDQQIFCNGGIFVAGQEPQITAFAFKNQKLEKIFLNNIQGLTSVAVVSMIEQLNRHHQVTSERNYQKPFVGKAKELAYDHGRLTLTIFTGSDTDAFQSASLVYSYSPE